MQRLLITDSICTARYPNKDMHCLAAAAVMAKIIRSIIRYAEVKHHPSDPYAVLYKANTHVADKIQNHINDYVKASRASS